MQVPKSEVRLRIIEAARVAFINQGVKATSMQQIARDAQVAVGNIYHYFASKDEIFVAILTPLLQALEKQLSMELSRDYLSINFFYSPTAMRQMMGQMMELIRKYRSGLKLLLFEAVGTSLEHFLEEYARQQAQVGMEYIQLMKQKYPHISVDISPHFLQMGPALWLALVKLIVQLPPDTPEDEIEKLISDYVEYSTAGWKSLLHV